MKALPIFDDNNLPVLVMGNELTILFGPPDTVDIICADSAQVNSIVHIHESYLTSLVLFLAVVPARK